MCKANYGLFVRQLFVLRNLGAELLYFVSFFVHFLLFSVYCSVTRTIITMKNNAHKLNLSYFIIYMYPYALKNISFKCIFKILQNVKCNNLKILPRPHKEIQNILFNTCLIILYKTTGIFFITLNSKFRNLNISR